VRSLRLLRLANPVVRAVLESPIHRALSGTLLTVAYRGRRTGRSFRIPLRYAETTDGAIVALAVRPERKLWWRSFAEPSEATLTLRGDQVQATGALAAGDDRQRALEAYVTRFPRTADLARDAAIVVFRGKR
jgi:hypothetical protein